MDTHDPCGAGNLAPTPEHAQLTATRSQWRPPRALMHMFVVARWLLLFASTMLVVLTCFQASETWHWRPNFLGLVLVLPIILLTVIAHELGHLLGARRAGMFVVRVQLGPVEFLAQRRGWKVRWCKAQIKAAGFVLAYPHPGKALRGQFMAFVSSGPAMNLLMGVVFGVVAWSIWPSGFAWLFCGAAIYSLCVGIVNLFPVEHPIASDGLQLLRCFNGMDDDDPDMLLPRLYGLSISGVTADRLPKELLDRLASGPPPSPLLYVWFALWAHVNRDEWVEASRLEAQLDCAMATLSPEVAAGMVDVYGFAWTEIACARVLAGGRLDVPLDTHLPAATDWYHASLRQRVIALDAAMAGDDAACRAALIKAESLSEASFDSAGRIAEARQRKAIQHMLTTRKGVQENNGKQGVAD